MSQKQQILRHLKGGKTLTPLQALKKFGCLTLSQRVTELRMEGHKIMRAMVEVRGMLGEKKKVGQYWMM